CSEESFIAALTVAQQDDMPVMVIGGGTNLIVADAGYRGLVIRYREQKISAAGTRITVGAGAVLQDLVDFANRHGLRGLQTLAGIPGWVGAAVYGNAGAYGHAISERVAQVRFFDGSSVRLFDNTACQFRYRESIFKANKDWVIFSSELVMEKAEAA